MIFLPARSEEELYIETEFQILHEDSHFLVVNKPAPLPVHAVGRFKKRNLLSLLLQQFPENSLRLVNRLDSETSGLVLVAKTKEAAGNLGLQFENRTVQKEYRALVFGTPNPREGRIQIALGWTTENQFHMRVLDESGESAETAYEVVQEMGNYSFLKIRPVTGRTHQIRAHLAFLGHPIVGDKIYIDPKIYEEYIHTGWLESMREKIKLPRLALHASKLQFKHPETGAELCFSSPIPALFSSLS